MKTSGKLARIAVSAALAAVVAAAGAAAAGPKIVFKTDVWNFGKLKAGAEPSYEFVFKNEGDATLAILGVETSCGCAAALVSDRKIAPGRSGKIKVTFNSQGYAGEVVKYVFVETNDPENSRVQLKIEALVDVPPQPRIDLSRYSYDAGLLVEGEMLSADVVVQNRGELELRFECTLAGAAFEMNGKPVAFPVRVAAGKDVDLRIRMSPSDRIGLIREFILFKTNDPLRSTISMTLSGYVVTKDQLKQIFEKYKDVIR